MNRPAHVPVWFRRAGVTLVEAVLALGLLSLLVAVFYPMLTRGVRTMFHVVGQAGLQSGMRGALERIVRDTHQAQTVLECTTQSVTLFKPDSAAVTAPETTVEANRNDPAGLPCYPHYGGLDGRPLAREAKVFTSGWRVIYRHVVKPPQLWRIAQPGRLAGTVQHDEATRRSWVTTVSFEPDGSVAAREEVVASDVKNFVVVPVAYGPTGVLSLAGTNPTSACALSVRILGSVVAEGDKPEAPVEEEAATKAWLQRRLSEALHPGASSALDDRPDF